MTFWVFALVLTNILAFLAGAYYPQWVARRIPRIREKAMALPLDRLKSIRDTYYLAAPGSYWAFKGDRFLDATLLSQWGLFQRQDSVFGWKVSSFGASHCPMVLEVLDEAVRVQQMLLEEDKESDGLQTAIRKAHEDALKAVPHKAVDMRAR